MKDAKCSHTLILGLSLAVVAAACGGTEEASSENNESANNATNNQSDNNVPANNGAANNGSGGTRYTLEYLGTLGGTVTLGVALNELGQVVGKSNIADNAGEHAFLYENGNLMDLHPSDSDLRGSEATDINESGQISFSGYENTPACTAAFRFQEGSLTPIGALGFNTVPCSNAEGINDNGVVAGSSSIQGTGFGAYTWDGALTNIGNLDETFSNAAAYDVNNAGQVTGQSADANGKFHAFLFDGTMTDLGALAGFEAERGIDINAAGVVVGFGLSGNGDSHAFKAESGVVTDLGTFGGDISSAEGINDNGVIVGWAENAEGEGRPFIYEGGTMRDLGSLVDGKPETVTLDAAVAINNRGQVVVLGLDSSLGAGRKTYLLTPVP